MSIENLTIRHLGPKGDGIGHGPKSNVFVDRSLPGDLIRARVSRDRKGIFRGEIIEVVSSSPHRRRAICPHYDKCGNCSLLHAEQSFYQNWKQEVVFSALQKLGMKATRWEKPVFLGGQNRRRITFNAVLRSREVAVGYYQRRTDQITDISSCGVADPELFKLRELLKPYLKHVLVPGTPTDIFLQRVENAVDVVITGPIGKNGRPDRQVYEALRGLTQGTEIVRVGWRADTRVRVEPIAERGNLVAKFGKLEVKLPPAAFLQPTVEGEKALVSAILSALPAKGKFADLFSGCGTFSGHMLLRGSVDAFESDPSAILAMKEARGNEDLRAVRRDLYENPLKGPELEGYDAVVFDPPRSGCPDQAAALAKSDIPILIGVSCNPATFARDARTLCNGGYWLESIQVVDQFLWSHHVEVVGVFKKRKGKKA